MLEGRSARTPAHLWIVGLIATAWNMFGAYDYLMTRTRNMEYLSSVPGMNAGEVLAYIDSFPIWAQIGWGLGVWGGLAGSILLLTRSRFAVHSFALSLLGMVLSFSYQLFGPPGPAAMHEGPMAMMPWFIMAFGVALLWYSLEMAKRGVIR